MKQIKNFAVAGCSLFLLCQCATQAEVRDLNYQIRAVNQRLEEVKGTTVNQMQRRQASSVNRLEEVDSEVSQLRSLLEESSAQTSQVREQYKEDIVALQNGLEQLRTQDEQRLNDLEDKVNQLTMAVDQLRQAKLSAAEQRARDAARRAEEARRRTAAMSDNGGVVRVVPDGRKTKKISAADSTAGNGTPSAVATRAAEPSAPPVTSASGGGDQFTRAMELFQKNNYKEAYRVLGQLAATEPKGDIGGETYFFMGESLFNQGEYDLAILEYQKVISKHPQHKRTATALLRQGMSFEKLTDNETAKIIYTRLVKEYAGTKEADVAQQRLEGLR